MSTRPEFVQVEAGEDVASVKDRLAFIRGKSVLLIWPEEGTALQRKLDLVLIQREAMRRAIRLALVTHDPIVIKHAGELNISTFETIGASERGRWKRGRSKVFLARFQRPKDEPEPEELMEVVSRVRGERRQSPWLRRMLARLAILSALLGLTAGAAYVFVPAATVYLTPSEQTVEASVTITANPALQTRQVDVENAVIPTITLRLEVSDTASVSTTGSQGSDDAPAVGVVIFINQTAAEVEIPAETVVSTGTGTPIMFRTTQAVTLPAGAGQEVEAPIQAMPAYAGVQGNVDVNFINTVVGPLERTITVVNRIPTFGGESRPVRAVSQQDREALLGLLRQQLQARAYVEMQAQLTPNQFIIDETVRIVEERSDSMVFSAQVGEIADTLTLTMSAVVQAVAVDEQLAQQIVFARMANQIARGRVIRPNSIVYQRSPITVDTAAGLITFVMSGTGLVTGQVNAGQLQERLARRTVEDALRYLREEADIAENSEPRIVISPGWMNRMPILPMRITIVVEVIQ